MAQLVPKSILLLAIISIGTNIEKILGVFAANGICHLRKIGKFKFNRKGQVPIWFLY